ncbi:MAG TPA: PGPGW domain-containing protein [Methylomirabilota bacterium]|jgi:hypothetical protein|nr:PGPGW domain-containing protein [Methylomirabilota bacterium]
MIRTTGYLLWRLFRIICGFLLLGAGVFLSLPGIPGPGIVLIVLSFGILSRDFHWAKRAQEYMHRKWHELRNRKEQSARAKESHHG